MNTTFSQFLPEHLRRHNLPPELGETAATVVSACVQIGRLVRLGALAGVLGTAGSGNVQGEEQKKLDVLANDLLIDALRQNPQVAGLASEEEDSFVACHENGRFPAPWTASKKSPKSSMVITAASPTRSAPVRWEDQPVPADLRPGGGSARRRPAPYPPRGPPR